MTNIEQLQTQKENENNESVPAAQGGNGLKKRL